MFNRNNGREPFPPRKPPLPILQSNYINISGTVAPSREKRAKSPVNPPLRPHSRSSRVSRSRYGSLAFKMSFKLSAIGLSAVRIARRSERRIEKYRERSGSGESSEREMNENASSHLRRDCYFTAIRGDQRTNTPLILIIESYFCFCCCFEVSVCVAGVAVSVIRELILKWRI